MNKRARVIDYFSETCTASQVVNMLMQYMTEECWENLYDRLNETGVFDEDEDTPIEMLKALSYIRESIEDDTLLIYKSTVSRNLCHRMPADTDLDTYALIDILEEYGEENNLPEGWWEEYGDIEDWFIKL